MKDDGTACIADFGLISIALDMDATNTRISTGGAARVAYRWMGPELFHPERFGLPKFCLTKESDCYAFGMVVYEVSSWYGARLFFLVPFICRRSYRVRTLLRRSNSRGGCRTRY